MQVDEMPTAVMGPALQSVFFSRARHRGTMTQRDKHLIWSVAQSVFFSRARHGGTMAQRDKHLI